MFEKTDVLRQVRMTAHPENGDVSWHRDKCNWKPLARMLAQQKHEAALRTGSNSMSASASAGGVQTAMPVMMTLKKCLLVLMGGVCARITLRLAYF